MGRQKDQESPKIIYKITVQTSDAYHNAGTDSSVYVDLVGKDGTQSTGFLKLDNFLQKDFGKGKKQKFKVTAKDVGMPTIVRIKLASGLTTDEWCCDYITVTIAANGDKATFPVYNWFQKDMQVVRGEGVLPQKVTNRYIKDLRRKEIQNNKALYQWLPMPEPEDIGWGFPRYVNANSYQELPPLFKRNAVKEENMTGDKVASIAKLLVSKIQELPRQVKSLDAYNRFYKNHSLKRQTSNFLDGWDTDEGMGRQVLTGISPLMVSRCTSLPDYFNVTNEDVSKYLSKSLEEEMKAGKIYISDYKEALGGVERNVVKGKELYCPDAVGLFHVNDEGKFLPIAIQLVPGDRGYLFTPEDNNRWLLAKMYFRCSGTSEHEWVYHFLLTHILMEPFAVAFFRCLPLAHPVYKLLRPHLQTVSAINTDARDGLIGPNSLANQVMAIMEKFVGSVLRYYYKSDADICEDYELQNWAKDVTDQGLAWQDDNTRGMPTEITSIEQLIEICVTLMFSSSAQHAAVNFGQFETYKFAPNSPSNMRLPPPKKDDEVTDELVLQSLPSADSAITVVALTFTLSAFSPDEVSLFSYQL
ncbi:allene oxide synthase-lipoxygenase protein-like [Clavelina lepadiformis]|uniref:allene oxide synthase-lipoxygenase protein-like n=1 Tax=Clavelina lepadiformis TaxID=159417 RepID=UPI0040433D6D